LLRPEVWLVPFPTPQTGGQSVHWSLSYAILKMFTFGNKTWLWWPVAAKRLDLPGCGRYKFCSAVDFLNIAKISAKSVQPVRSYRGSKSAQFKKIKKLKLCWPLAAKRSNLQSLNKWPTFSRGQHPQHIKNSAKFVGIVRTYNFCSVVIWRKLFSIFEKLRWAILKGTSNDDHTEKMA